MKTYEYLFFILNFINWKSDYTTKLTQIKDDDATLNRCYATAAAAACCDSFTHTLPTHPTQHE